MSQDSTGKSNTNEEKKQGSDRAAFVPVWVAVVTGIVTIAVALLSSPLLEKLLEPEPTPSATPEISVSLTPSSQPILTATSSPTPVEIVLPADTSTPEIIISDTPDLPSPTSSVASEMFVRIAASQTSGKAPFNAKFDARDSYVQAPDGTVYECRRGACRYSWYIFLNGQDFARPETTGGTLDFRFQQKGVYSISVYICHGSDSPTCGNGATLVIVD